MFLFPCFRLKEFKASLFRLFDKEHAQSLSVEKVQEHVNKEHSAEPFSEEELWGALEKMMDDNQLMVSDKVVFLI